MAAPTNEEIESELAKVGKRGEKREEKKEHIKKLYPNLTNPQGMKLYNVLTGFRNY